MVEKEKDIVPWLRDLAERGGKGVVNNIDARAIGRVADEIERLRTALQQYANMEKEGTPLAWRGTPYLARAALGQERGVREFSEIEALEEIAQSRKR